MADNDEIRVNVEKVGCKQFTDKIYPRYINVLSRSTIFELGVDVGELETVLMKNVPPRPAYYAQSGKNREENQF